MKSQSTAPAFSVLSTGLLLIAVASALISVVRGNEFTWTATDWIGGICSVALVLSLINDARK